MESLNSSEMGHKLSDNYLIQVLFRAQEMFEQQEGLQAPSSAATWHRASNQIAVMRKFIGNIVRHRLQSLGIQHLDCNEILDKWEMKNRSPFIPFPVDDNNNNNNYYEKPPGPSNVSVPADIPSPFISKPNSALFQVMPSSVITKTIFSKFVGEVELLKDVLNNATCNLIYTSVWLLLPEIKLLWGRQLDTNRNSVFIQEWIRLIVLAATELKPESPKDVVGMINREIKKLTDLAQQLYKGIRKVYYKIEDISKYGEENFRRALAQLNPKSLKKLDAFDVNIRKKYSPDVIHFDPQQLHSINIPTNELFEDHIFLGETNRGEMMIKNDLEECWSNFGELEFEQRRRVFLTLTENLQSCFRTCIATVQNLQEIYTEGYPGSIKSTLKEVVEELKVSAKREDLGVLIKTSVVTHVICLHEMFTRLLYISKEVKGVTKQFKKSLEGISLDTKTLKRKYKANKKLAARVSSDNDASILSPQSNMDNEYGTSGEINRHINAQLVVPYYSFNVDMLMKT